MRIDGWKMVLAAGVVTQLAMGCTPTEEHIAKVFDKAIEECKSSDKQFAEVEIVTGDKREVMRSVCDGTRGEVALVDEFNGEAKLGPYTLRSGLDEDTRVWVLTDFSYAPLDKSLLLLEEEDPGADTYDRLVAQLEKAQKDLPDNEWIRMTRLQALLDKRRKTRKTSDDVTIGREAQAFFDEVVKWAGEQGKPGLEQVARAKVVQHLVDYDGKMQVALDSLDGSDDDRLLKAIEVAQKEKDEKAAKDYQAELEQRKVQRVSDTKMLTERREQLKKVVCGELSKLSTAGVSDQAVSKQIAALKSSTQCI